MGPNKKLHVNCTHHHYYQTNKNPHQKIMGKLLYYTRVVESTILEALGYIDANQDNIKETTAQDIKQLLDYCATHPDSTILYK